MIREKYAIRFPDIISMNDYNSVSIFSEKSIQKASNTFFDTFDALGSLAGLVLQKTKTKELSKQISSQKRALDETVENQKLQMQIEFEEYTKRLQERVKFEKEKMELDLKEMLLQTGSIVNKFSSSFEEQMKKSQVLADVIKQEKNFLLSVQMYINDLANDYSQRREYVKYCEMQRKSLELVNTYVKEMI